MENLYLRLEQLLEDFVAGFLGKILKTGVSESERLLPNELNAQYIDYLNRFQTIQTSIERFAPSSKEEALLRSRALAVLKSSSENIINTFSFEG
ncbi:hypothetical protein KJ966_08075 [bacterium]|nr:hypothetical protein [bacterium]